MPTILIVDDSGFQRSFLKRALAEGGHSTVEAKNGEEALEIVARQQFDCILTDLIMPDMRGFALLEALAEQGTDIPIVVLTADIQERVGDRCLELGAARVLHKPAKPNVLNDAVAEILAGATSE